MKQAQTALVTGASDRIGRSIAIFLAESGINIALHYNSAEEKAAKTCMEIKSKGVDCEIFKADFSDSESVSALFEEISKKFQLNILINSASIFYETDFIFSEYSEFDTFFNINFKAPYILTKEFARNAAEKSLIINILDTKIAKNSSKHFDYLLTKKFLEDFTLLSALHLSPKIRVNGIAPGLILPPPGKNDEYLQQLSENIPLKKTGSLLNINQTLKFFLENDFVTGQIIYVDGGENL